MATAGMRMFTRLHDLSLPISLLKFSGVLFWCYCVNGISFVLFPINTILLFKRISSRIEIALTIANKGYVSP